MIYNIYIEKQPYEFSDPILFEYLAKNEIEYSIPETSYAENTKISIVCGNYKDFKKILEIINYSDIKTMLITTL